MTLVSNSKISFLEPSSRIGGIDVVGDSGMWDFCDGRVGAYNPEHPNNKFKH